MYCWNLVLYEDGCVLRIGYASTLVVLLELGLHQRWLCYRNWDCVNDGCVLGIGIASTLLCSRNWECINRGGVLGIGIAST